MENKVKLTPCPICGKQPVIIRTPGSGGVDRYKYFCSGNGIHVSAGDWKVTVDLAMMDWERRVQRREEQNTKTTSNYQIIKNIIEHDIDEETFAEILVSGDIREFLDIPSYDTKEEMLAWLRADRKKVLELHFLGLDSWGRQVFEDQNGRIWKNTETDTHRTVRLCTALYNAFDGEPDTPMDVMTAYKNVAIVFLPKRSVNDG